MTHGEWGGGGVASIDAYFPCSYVVSRYKSLAVMSFHCYRSLLEIWSLLTNNATFAHKHL